MFHNTPLFRCYFGNTKDQLYPAEYLALSDVQDILALPPFSRIQKVLALQRLIFLRQTHSAEGTAITDLESAYAHPSFNKEGDYLITNHRHIGLGVMTADCVPIIIADMVHGAIGIAHAGWRGTTAGISTIMLTDMHKTFGTQPEQVTVIFGPSAKICCYKVSDSFTRNLEHIRELSQCIITKHEQLYFDGALCNRMLLENAGVPKNSFYTQYNVCTICDTTFYSHRRGDTGRQMTIVSLV